MKNKLLVVYFTFTTWEFTFTCEVMSATQYSRQEISWTSFRTVVEEKAKYEILGVYVHKLPNIADTALQSPASKKSYYSVKFITLLTKKRRIPFVIAIPDSYIVPLSHDISQSLFGGREADFTVQYIKFHSMIDVDGGNVTITNPTFENNYMSGEFNTQIAYAKDLWSRMSSNIDSTAEGSGIMVMSISSLVVIFNSKVQGGTFSSNHKMHVYHFASQSDLLDEQVNGINSFMTGCLTQRTDDILAEEKRISLLEESISKIQEMVPDRDTMDKYRNRHLLESRRNPNLTILPDSGAKSELLSEVPVGSNTIDTGDEILVFDDDDDTVIANLDSEIVTDNIANSVSQAPEIIGGSSSHGGNAIATQSSLGESSFKSLFEDVPEDDVLYNFAQKYTFPDVVSSETFSQVISDTEGSNISVNIGVTYIVCSALMFFRERSANELPPGEIVEQKNLKMSDIENILLKNKLKTVRNSLSSVKTKMSEIYENYISEDKRFSHDLQKLAKVHGQYKKLLLSKRRMREVGISRIEIEQKIEECKELISELNIKRVENKNKLSSNIYELDSILNSINLL